MARIVTLVAHADNRRAAKRHGDGIAASLDRTWLAAGLISLALSTAARAQTPAAFVRQSWTVRDGLPVNSITDIHQSKTGYIWLSTFDGLVRFDGMRFSIFNTANSRGLPSNRLIRIFETRDSSLWLVSEGRQLIHFREGKFSVVENVSGVSLESTALHESRDGKVWIATSKGLSTVLNGRATRAAPTVITSDVYGVAEGADGTIWVAGKAGLNKVNGNRVAFVPGSQEIGKSVPSAIAVDSSNRVWVGTPTTVFQFRDSITRVPLAGSGRNSPISYAVTPRSAEIIANSGNNIYRLDARGANRIFSSGATNGNALTATYDRRGRLWYSTGPDVFADGKRVTQKSDGQPTPNSVVLSGDREGSVWIGTTASGLIRQKPALFKVFGVPEGLGADNVFVAASDKSGAVWTLRDGGVSRVMNGRASMPAPVPGLASYVSSIYEDRTGRLWFGKIVCTQPDMRCGVPPATPIRGEVRAIHEDPDGALWFGASDGLFLLRGDRWTRFNESDGAPGATVRSFARTRDAALWMGTNGGGVSRFSNGRFTNITTRTGFPSDFVRTLYADEDGWLWAGTEGMGLARIDPSEWTGDKTRPHHIVSIRQNDGLFDNGVHQILDDKLGRLWMSSNRGIFWVARETLNAFAAGRARRVQSTSYAERDGLRNREANGGTEPAGTRTPDGHLWFATQGGLVTIDPRDIRSDNAAPNVVIEQVRAGAVIVDHARDSVELSSGQRNIQIDYTALSFLATENLRFRYRLDPYDKDWTDADTRRTAFYTRVPPGYYTFQVRATNDAGAWNGPSATMILAVKPLFYEKRSFIILVLVVIMLLAWTAVRWRIAQLKGRANQLQTRVDERTAELREREARLASQNVQLENQAEQLKELDRAKSRFFANVSHEFRTPLTLTIGPLEDLREHLAAHEESDSVSRIDIALRSARRLFTLVTQILDVAKLEAGQMRLDAAPGDLVAFTRGVASSFTDLAKKKTIDFRLDLPSTEVTTSFDPDAIEKVLVNLLANAFKFTPDSGRIVIGVEAATETDGDVVRISVADSGPGIPDGDIPHVFERFYQVDESNTRAHPGTGIGLALAKELVELHSGTIAVENGNRSGAKFVVTLPRSGEVMPATPGEGVTPDDVTTLLIVDDSEDMRSYIRSRFDSKYRIVEAGNGSDGIRLARESLPDLVISDVVMPGTSGHQLCDALRSSSETDFIPIVLLTAQSDPDQRISGLYRGADDYITKPFDMRELEARVENLIASRRRLRERFSGDGVRLKMQSLGDRSPDDRAFLDRLTSALEANLGNPDFGVSELAAAVFQDRSNLFRRTRSLLGESPSDLLRRVRLDRAARLLCQADDGIAEVAYGVGFNSVSAFCRAFREAYEATPSQFRASKRAAVR